MFVVLLGGVAHGGCTAGWVLWAGGWVERTWPACAHMLMWLLLSGLRTTCLQHVLVNIEGLTVCGAAWKGTLSLTGAGPLGEFFGRVAG